MAYDVNPDQGDLATARAAVDGVLAACVDRLPTDESVAVALCWSDDPVVAEVMGGADGTCLAPDRVEVAFTSRGEDWTAAIGWMTAYQYGRAWTRGRLPDEACVFWWQEFLESAVGDRLATEVASGYEAPWTTVDRGLLAAWWPTVREGLGRRRDEPLVDTEPDPGMDTVDVPDLVFDRFLPQAYASVLGSHLLETRELTAVPDVARSVVREELDAAFE